MKRRDFLLGTAGLMALPLHGATKECEGALGVTWACPDNGDKPKPKPEPDAKHGFVCTATPFDVEKILRTLSGGGAGSKPNCPRERPGSDFYYAKVKAWVPGRGDRYIIRAERGLKNAYAAPCRAGGRDQKKVIAYDPEFFDRLGKQSGTGLLAGYAILFHEIAHHINDDTENPHFTGEWRKEQELWADFYAGQKMAENNFPLPESVAVFSMLGSGGNTHPPAYQRKQAATSGWHDHAAKRGWGHYRHQFNFR